MPTGEERNEVLFERPDFLIDTQAINRYETIIISLKSIKLKEYSFPYWGVL